MLKKLTHWILTTLVTFIVSYSDLHTWYGVTTEGKKLIPMHLALTDIQAGHSTLNNGVLSPSIFPHSKLLEEPAGVTEPWSLTDNAPLMEQSQETNVPLCFEFRPVLSPSQLEICQRHYDHMRAIILAAKTGLTECQHQFRNHQWNCSALGSGDYQQPEARSENEIIVSNLREEPENVHESSTGNNNVLTGTPLATDIQDSKFGDDGKFLRKQSAYLLEEGPQTRTLPPSVSHKTQSMTWDLIISRGSREIALANAIWSAAVTQVVARACRDGSLESCTCGRTSRPRNLKREWQWAGCGDNMHYSYKFGKEFVDAIEYEKPGRGKREKAKILANLHNNEVGRRTVMKKAKIACKCHGISGSCALITCWHQVPSLRIVGDHLMKRYEKAHLVKVDRRGRLLTKRSLDAPPGLFDLVFVENSPNYCERNEKLGIIGTQGRTCNNNTGDGSLSCKQMCCNRGSRTRVTKSKTRCNCKFIWCCQVSCDQCPTLEIYDICN